MASTLLDTAEDSAYFYLVNELHEGGELFERLIQRGQQSEADSAYILRQVLELLVHCHSKGIVHRDLKPENILFRNPPGSVGTHATELAIAVVDFGVAEMMAPGQVLTARCGSAHYMAPEVISGKYTQSAELWTVGVILYILLSGEMPFTGSNTSAIFSRIKEGQYSTTGGVWEHVSEDAKDLLHALLQRNPAARPSAAAALQHRWVDGSASAAGHPLAPSIVSALVKHQAVKGLQRAALKALCPLLDDDERMREARRGFESIDTSGDGYVSLDEFIVGLRKLAPADFGDAGDFVSAGGQHQDKEGLLAQLFCEIDAGAQTEKRRERSSFSPPQFPVPS